MFWPPQWLVHICFNSYAVSWGECAKGSQMAEMNVVTRKQIKRLSLKFKDKIFGKGWFYRKWAGNENNSEQFRCMVLRPLPQAYQKVAQLLYNKRQHNYKVGISPSLCGFFRVIPIPNVFSASTQLIKIKNFIFCISYQRFFQKYS